MVEAGGLWGDYVSAILTGTWLQVTTSERKRHSRLSLIASGVSCFEHTKEQNRGRPWMIWPEDGLELVLAWTRTRGLLMVLQLNFGMTYTNLDDYLLFAKRIIIMVLQDHPMAKVQILSSEKIEEFKDMVHRQHPYLSDIWCTMDGLKLMFEHSGDALIQEPFYNGWVHDHYLTSVMCFCPDGTISIVFAIFLARFTIAKLQTMEIYMMVTIPRNLRYR
jgi:hypothetical protein